MYVMVSEPLKDISAAEVESYYKDKLSLFKIWRMLSLLSAINFGG